MGIKKKEQLCHTGRQLHKVAQKFQRVAVKLNRDLITTKRRLKEAEDLVNTPLFTKANLNKQTQNFILSQLKHQKLTPKGRRFSLEDKMFALTLYKQSPRGYRLLRKIFALPSKKTLTNLLQKLSFKTGINDNIFSILKSSCESLPENDRCCSIIFDEMSLKSSLVFDEKNDIIAGFQDNGPGLRKPLFADKVMVFMARGVGKNWKQPLAYYFNEGGMKTDILIICLKEIIRKMTSSGFKVR